MKRGLTFLMAGGLLWGFFASCAFAQRGMGEPAGVARQIVKPEIVTLSGRILTVETEPCKMTTGRAVAGTHFLLETPKGEKLNIHLGPTVAVDHIAAQLPTGKKVTVKAFRTAEMPESHYVAQSLALGDSSIQLRDEDLRPFWARGNAVSRGRGGPQRGPGYGQSPEWGRGPSYGRGPGRGLGQRSRGYGRGQGQGTYQFQGQGYGRGRGYR